MNAFNMDTTTPGLALQYHQPQSSLTQPVIDLNNCYTVKQVTNMFGVVERTLRYWRQQQKLTAGIVDKRVLFDKPSTDTALARWQQLGFL